MTAETIRPLPRRIGVIGAFLLVSASASLGSYYGYLVGAHAHWLVGIIFAGAALGGEMLKPYAVAHSIAALHSREYLHGTACAGLAIVCVAYSFTSELGLAAGSRSDLASERRQSTELISAHRERRARAVAELQALPPARSPSELGPLITKLKATRGTNGCKGRPLNNTARNACAKVSDLMSEAARAQQRDDLEKRLASADADLVSAPIAVADADPLASALSSYARSAGADVPADTLSPWLALIPVLFLELGSALSVVVLRPMPAPTPTNAAAASVSQADVASAAAASEITTATALPQPQTPVLAPPASADEISSGSDIQLSARVVEFLQRQGGRVFSGQRAFAGAIGISKSRANELLHSLAAKGRIAIEPSRRGTAIALVN
jgi:hypothetical protein